MIADDLLRQSLFIAMKLAEQARRDADAEDARRFMTEVRRYLAEFAAPVEPQPAVRKLSAKEIKDRIIEKTKVKSMWNIPRPVQLIPKPVQVRPSPVEDRPVMPIPRVNPNPPPMPTSPHINDDDFFRF